MTELLLPQPAPRPPSSGSDSKPRADASDKAPREKKTDDDQVSSKEEVDKPAATFDAALAEVSDTQESSPAFAPNVNDKAPGATKKGAALQSEDDAGQLALPLDIVQTAKPDPSANTSVVDDKIVTQTPNPEEAPTTRAPVQQELAFDPEASAEGGELPLTEGDAALAAPAGLTPATNADTESAVSATAPIHAAALGEASRPAPKSTEPAAKPNPTPTPANAGAKVDATREANPTVDAETASAQQDQAAKTLQTSNTVDANGEAVTNTARLEGFARETARLEARDARLNGKPNPATQASDGITSSEGAKAATPTNAAPVGAAAANAPQPQTQAPTTSHTPSEFAATSPSDELPPADDFSTLDLDVEGLDSEEPLLTRLIDRPGAPVRLAVQATASPRVFAGEIANVFKRQSEGGATRFEIRLDPPELGRIDVRLEVAQDGQLRAHMTVDRQEALDVLQRDEKALERALQQAGFDLDSDALNYSMRERGRGSDFGSPRNGNAQNDAEADEPELDPWVAADINLRPGGVDIRA